MNWLLVAAGGALGSLARYSVSLALARASAAAFPWPTLFVNLAGCLLAGAVAALLEARVGPQALGIKAFFAVGLLGGFTTFSAFGVETVQLAQAGRAGLAGLNALANLGGGVALAAIGYAVARALA